MKAVFIVFICTWLCLIGVASCVGVQYAEVPCESIAGCRLTYLESGKTAQNQ